MPRRLFTMMLAVALTAAWPVGAEFYKYTDEKGQVHFVDDMTKIPEGSQNALKTYKERYDHLPAAERKRIHEQQEMTDAEKEKANSDRLNQIMEIRRKEREAYLAGKRGACYALYFTNGGSVKLDLSGDKGAFDVTWISVSSGVTTRTYAAGGHRLTSRTIEGGRALTVTAPYRGGWVAAFVKNE